MACQFDVYLNAGQNPAGTEAALAALELVEALEDQMTVYREHSEISRLNRTAAERPVVVERRLFGLLQQAVELHGATEGAFDITSGPLSRVWGFYRRAGRVPSPAELEEARQRVGSRWLKLDSEAGTVQFLRPGMEINLGAIGKGYALDRCAELLLERGVGDFLIHGGQSSILARGARGGPAGPNRGWCVALRHPLKHDQRLAEVWLRNRALGTSGSGQQFFHYQGRRFGHILDPRTGLSVEGILSATVLAPTAALADALSTAAFVMGLDKSLEFCGRHPAWRCCSFARERAGQLELHTSGFQSDELRTLVESP